MKSIRIILILLIPLFWACKQKIESAKPQEQKTIPKEEVFKPLSKNIKELGEFVGISLTDSADIDRTIAFKRIDNTNVVSTVEMDEALNLYNRMMKRGEEYAWPIFEIKGTDDVIIPVKGIGFGGPIWAKVLIDRKTLEIKKIEFQHKAESEGYGAAMTQSSFEDKFAGTKIDLEKNTFILQKNMEKRTDDGTIIDGISSATMTSAAAVEMVNYGLQKYRGYFEKN